MMSNKELKEIKEMASELADAGGLEGAELGEWWTTLNAVAESFCDGASEEFKEAFAKEVRKEHEYFKKEYSIEEVSVTRTVTTRQLKWMYE